MIDWDPDYAEYLEQHTDLVGDEEYTGRPLESSDTRVGTTHHPDCPSKEFDPSWECCKSYWEKDYTDTADRRAEEEHEEWWQ